MIYLVVEGNRFKAFLKQENAEQYIRNRCNCEIVEVNIVDKD